VNTKGLAKHYDRLTPSERLPLIMAASARGDEQERSRLAMSAPRVGYRAPDHFGLAQAFNELSSMHLMELLDLAANYFQALGLADSTKGKTAEKVFGSALLLGYLFKVTLAGWRLFCAEYHLPPELCWSCLPGFGTVKRAEETVEAAAFTHEEVSRHWQRLGRDAAKVPTAEGIAAGLRECFKARAEWWG
jgi:hypothetical protein